MEITEVEFHEGIPPTVCDHCGSDHLEDIGLVGPKCLVCGRFSVSHLTFGEAKKVDRPITIEVEEEQ